MYMYNEHKEVKRITKKEYYVQKGNKSIKSMELLLVKPMAKMNQIKTSKHYHLLDPWNIRILKHKTISFPPQCPHWT